MLAALGKHVLAASCEGHSDGIVISGLLEQTLWDMPSSIPTLIVTVHTPVGILSEIRPSRGAKSVV